MTPTNPTDAQMKLADVTDADVTAALPTESELKLARKCTARANFLLEKKTLQSILNGEQDTWPEVVASILAIRATEARAQGLVEWQDISTAPKDGTHILVCRRANYSPQWGFNQVPPTVAHWWNAEGEQGFYASVDSIGEHALDCSHWKPLGDPPIAGRAITADTQIGERCKMCGTAAPDHFSKECHRPDCAWRAKHSQHGGERER